MATRGLCGDRSMKKCIIIPIMLFLALVTQQPEGEGGNIYSAMTTQHVVNQNR